METGLQGTKTRRSHEARDQHPCKNLCLGVAFKHGIEAALENGADILVNTDAENQYSSRYSPELIQPVHIGQADAAIGNCQTWKVKNFSALKKFLQWFGSASVRILSGSDVLDTVPGFRAYSRESLLRRNVKSGFNLIKI